MADAVARGADHVGLPRDGALVAAVSGGPDSMALLHGAARLIARGDRAWQLTVAHLDHALRPDSADDAAFVADVAESLGLTAVLSTAAVSALAREEGRSIEDAGREARYRFLAEVAGPEGWMATGHTADDVAETVLMNLMRGSGTTGVRGIPARRGRIVRPLIRERRQALRSLLDEGGLEYRLDPSNQDAAYLRNRVRGELMPLMESIRPGTVDRLALFASHAAVDEELLAAMAEAELARRTTDRGIDWRDPPSRGLGRRVLRAAIGVPAVSSERMEALLNAAESGRGGITVELGGGRFASVRERHIRLD